MRNDHPHRASPPFASSHTGRTRSPVSPGQAPAALAAAASAPPNTPPPTFAGQRVRTYPDLTRDLSTFDLHELVAQRSAEIRHSDPLTSALLATVAVHLRRRARNQRTACNPPTLQVRTLRELQPVITALRLVCIQEAAAAALGPSAPCWLHGTDPKTGTSRLEACKESRAELTRLLHSLRLENHENPDNDQVDRAASTSSCIAARPHGDHRHTGGAITTAPPPGTCR